MKHFCLFGTTFERYVLNQSNSESRIGHSNIVVFLFHFHGKSLTLKERTKEQESIVFPVIRLIRSSFISCFVLQVFCLGAKLVPRE